MRIAIRALMIAVVLAATATASRTALAADDAQFLSSSLSLPPASLCAGEQFPVFVSFKNTGTTTWTRLGQYGLEPDLTNGNVWRVSHVDLPTDNIAPGQLVRFMFVLLAPNTPGDYAFQWKMHNAARGTFGQLAQAPDGATISVTAPCPLSKVLLLKAGKGDAVQNWCDPSSPNLARSMSMPIAFVGRSTTGANAVAQLTIPAAVPPVQWQGNAVPHPTFAALAAPIDGISIVANANAPLGLQRLQFSTLDENSVAGHVGASCNVNIVQSVPDAAVSALTIDAPYTPQAVAHITLKNNGATAVDVPWSLMAVVHVGNRNLSSVVATSPTPVHLAAGATTLVNVPVASVLDAFNPASVTFNADVDPLNTLGENASDRGNNRQSAMVSLPAPPVQTLETRELDPQFAQAAGATFNDNIESNSLCYRLGVGNWKDNTWAPDRWFPNGGRKTGELFVADCVIGFGGKADPLAYGNFQLKNGWRVKSVDTPDISGASGNANVNNMVLPAVGSNNPQVSMHVFATTGHWVHVGIRILIEGPIGTDPYGTGGVACGAPPPRDQVNRFCSTNADCSRGATCSACGVCINPQIAFSCSSTTDCASGFVCTNGQCQQPGAGAPVSCNSNQTNCTGSCSDLHVDNNNCGACGNVCGQFGNNSFGSAVCASGSCVNTMTDSQNCGTAGLVCPAKPNLTGGSRPGVCLAGHCL